MLCDGLNGLLGRSATIAPLCLLLFIWAGALYNRAFVGYARLYRTARNIGVPLPGEAVDIALRFRSLRAPWSVNKYLLTLGGERHADPQLERARLRLRRRAWLLALSFLLPALWIPVMILTVAFGCLGTR